MLCNQNSTSVPRRQSIACVTLFPFANGILGKVATMILSAIAYDNPETGFEHEHTVSANLWLYNSTDVLEYLFWKVFQETLQRFTTRPFAPRMVVIAVPHGPANIGFARQFCYFNEKWQHVEIDYSELERDPFPFVPQHEHWTPTVAYRAPIHGSESTQALETR